LGGVYGGDGFLKNTRAGGRLGVKGIEKKYRLEHLTKKRLIVAFFI